MLKAIDGLQNQIKKTSADVIAHFDRSVSLLEKELDVITKAPTIEASGKMIQAADAARDAARDVQNGVVRVKQEGMDDIFISEDVDDDWQSDPKIAKFAEEMLAKLRNEVNPDIFNPERIQVLRTQVGTLGERLNRLESTLMGTDGQAKIAAGSDLDRKIQEIRTECRNIIKQNLSEFKTAHEERLSALETKIAQQLGLCEGLLEETTERLLKLDLPATRAQSVAATNGHVSNNDLSKDIPTRLTHSAMPSPPFVARTPPLVRSGTPSKSVSIPPETPVDKVSQRESVVSNPGTPSRVASPINRSTPVVTTYNGAIQLPADSRWRAVPSLAGHKRPRAAEDSDSEDRVAKRDSN
jgi:hypothetical protein